MAIYSLVNDAPCWCNRCLAYEPDGCWCDEPDRHGDEDEGIEEGAVWTHGGPLETEIDHDAADEALTGKVQR